MTEQQTDILIHMTGVERSGAHTRSHYVTGEGAADLPALEGLVTLGLVIRTTTPKFCDPADVVYMATEQGVRAAQEAWRARQPRLTRSQRRYRCWLDMDGAFEGGFRAWIKAGCPGFDRPWPARERSMWEVEP